MTRDVIRPPAPLPPGAEIELVITPSDNAILVESNRTETRVLTLSASFGEDDKLTAEVRWVVVNLAHYPHGG